MTPKTNRFSRYKNPTRGALALVKLAEVDAAGCCITYKLMYLIFFNQSSVRLRTRSNMGPLIVNLGACQPLS